MADGANNILGTKKIHREFGGRGYTFSVIVLAEHAEKESYVHSLRPNPLSAITSLPKGTSQKMLDYLTEKAMAEALRPVFLTRTEEMKFDDGMHGLAWSLWRGLRDNETDFGKPTGAAGEKLVYTSEAGREYTMTPAEGVQAVLDWMEKTVGDARIKELFDIRDGVENPPELGNSSGSETTVPPSEIRTNTDDSPGKS